MRSKIWIETPYKRIVSMCLALLMLLNLALPGFTAYAAEDDDYYWGYSGGTGTQTDPYILGDVDDFIALHNNVAQHSYYSKGLYFEVQPTGAGEGNQYNMISFLTSTKRVCIGGLGNDPAYWFYGNLNFNNATIYSEYPIFGTVSDGAVLSMGYIVISNPTSDNTSIFDEGSWGGLVSRVVSSDGGQTGTIHIQNFTLSVDVDVSSSYPSYALGGVIGEVTNNGTHPLDLQMDAIELSAKDGRNFSIYANHGWVGGVIGQEVSLGTGATTVSLSNVKVSGLLSNSCTGGAVGGYIGLTSKGSEVVFAGNNSEVIDAGLMVGDKKALFIGEENQALAYTSDTFAMTINGSAAALGTDNGADNALGGTVFGRLDLSKKVEGAGTQDSPYLIKTSNDLLLLAAAINTENPKALAAFGAGATRQSLRLAHYSVTGELDMTDLGFLGVGYYTSDTDYVSFGGEFAGTAEKPTITLQMNTRVGNLGLFPVLKGDETPAVVRDLTIAGNINTESSTVGGVAAWLGLASETACAGATITGIDSNINITGNKTGNAYFGGVAGCGVFTNALGETNLTLSDNSFGGSITTAGSYAGGLVGAISSKDQGNSALSLNIVIDGYKFTGSIAAQNSGTGNLGGCIGAILSTGGDTKSNVSTTKPGSGFSILYNTTKLQAANLELHGSITATASGLGGFAASMSGVDAAFSDVSVGGSYVAPNGMGGLAQNVGGKISVKNFGITSDAKFSISAINSVYSGLLFGNSSNAWVDLDGFTVDGAASIYVKTPQKFADLSGYTFYTNGSTYKNGTVMMGGVMNLVGEQSYTPVSVGTGDTAKPVSNSTASDESRYYFDLKPVALSGAGTEADPFVINSVAALQTMSVFNNLPSSLSWMMLDYFPAAAFPGNATNVDKVMYIKLAHFVISADLDLTGSVYYPAAIIGGSYTGVETDGKLPTITFAAGVDSTSLVSATRENQSGLFTTITAYDNTTPIAIGGFTLTGTIGGTYYPGGVAAGFYIPNSAARLGYPGVTSGTTNISKINLSGLASIGGTAKMTNFSNGRTLLLGSVEGGTHSITDIELTLPSGYSNYKENGSIVGNAPLADALIGRVTGGNTILELQRVAFPATYVGEVPATPDANIHYFGVATFISQFDAGTALYNYDSSSEEPKYSYQIEAAIMPASVGAQQIKINPPSARLDTGLGTAESPYVLDSPAQLYALAVAIQSNGVVMGGEKAGRLSYVNGWTADDLNDSSKKNTIVTYLAQAHYRMRCDIDFSGTNLLGYVGIGSLEHPFSGTFDGRGYTVTLSVGDNKDDTGRTDGAGNHVGLFSYISGATIQNLVVTTAADAINGVLVTSVSNSTDSNYASYNGMVAAVAMGGDNILDNIFVSGKITVDSTGVSNGNVYVGGFIGHVEAGTVKLVNLPKDYNSYFTIYANGSLASSSDSHYAGICPSAKDGYILYDGEDPSTSVILDEYETINAKVNQSFSVQLGSAFGGGNTNTYSLVTDGGENVKILPSDLGITLSSDGTLSGIPQKAGTYDFTIRVESRSNADPSYVTYDTKTYTIDIAHADYPELQLTTDITNISYATEQVELSFSNFPRPTIDGLDEKDTAVSNAVLAYSFGDNGDNGVVSIGTAADGAPCLNILSTGTTQIVVTKPQDDSYNELSCTYTITVTPATLSVIVKGQTVYYGSNTLPTNVGQIYIEGLRGTTGEIPYEQAQAQLTALGIDTITVNIPEALQNLTEMPAPGDYRVTINSLTAIPGQEGTFAAAMSNYSVLYRHGLIRVERKTIGQNDYTITLADGTVVTDKTSHVWFNQGFTIAPNTAGTNQYNKISLDGVNWVDSLTYTGEMAANIRIYLKSETLGYITDYTPLDLLIDMTPPTASVLYSTTQAGEPLFDTALDKTVYGGVYKNPFTVTLQGDDPMHNNVRSGIARLEYLLVEQGDDTKDIDASNLPETGWKTINNNTTKQITSPTAAGYYLRAVDGVGNVSSVAYYSFSDSAARAGWFVMDNTAPSITVTNAADYANWRTFENGVPAMQFTVSDTVVGVQKISYTVDGGAETSVPVSEDGSYTLDLSGIVTANKQYSIKIIAVDKVNNRAEQTVVVKKDDQVAGITLTPQWDTTSDLYTQSKTFQIDVSDYAPSGIASIAVKLGSTEYPLSVAQGTYSFVATQQGTYTVVVKKNSSTDAGELLTSTSTIDVPKIDATQPQLSVTGRTDTAAYTSGIWTANSVTLTFTNGAKAIQGKTRLYGYIKGQESTPLMYNDSYGVDDARNKLYLMDQGSYTLTNPYPNTINNTYCFYLQSESGVRSSVVEFTVRVDKDKPSINDPYVSSGGITTLLNKLTGGMFFKDAEIVVPVTDPHSGVNTVVMTLTPTDPGVAATTFTSSFNGANAPTARFVIPISFMGGIGLTATDMVGNHAEYSTTQTIIVDKAAPVYNLALSPAVGTEGYWIFGNVTAKLTGIADEGYFSSGLKELRYWTSDSAWAVGGSVPDDAAVVPAANFSGGAYSFTVGGATTPDGSYYINTAIYDNAGNVTVQSALVQKDTDIPVITGLSLGDKLKGTNGAYTFKSGSYSKPGDQITVSVEKRLSPQILKITLVNTENQTNEYTVTIPAGETSGTFTIPTLKQPNGVYTFTVYGGNGNPSNKSTPATLTTTEEIDADPPNVPVILPDTIAHYTPWTNALSAFGASYTETRGAPEWLEYAVVSGAAQTAPDSAFTKVAGSEGSSTSGKVDTFADTVPLGAFSKDGVYTVFFRVADASGLASATVAQTVRYDTTAPTMNAISYSVVPFTPHNTYPYTKLFGTAVSVNTSAADASTGTALGALAGKLTLEYTTVAEGGSLDNATAVWTKMDSAVALPGASNPFNGTLYFRATDEAGNTTALGAYANTGLISVNTAAPAAIDTITTNRDKVGDWSTDPVIFTLTPGVSTDTTLDHYQYATSADGKTWSAWVDFSNGDKTVVENTLNYTKNGAYQVKFRAVSYTGVAGAETVYGTVSKDDVKPVLNVQVTGVYSTVATTASWTNKNVVFTLSDAAANTAPLTYWVKVGTGEYIALTSGTAPIALPGGGTAVWNSSARTLTVSGNVDKCTGFAFKLTTAANLADEKSGYYLSLQQSTNHLAALNLADLIASLAPTGTVVTADSDAATLWRRAWYKSGDTAPDLLLQNQSSYANTNANGAPVCLEYTLTSGATVKASGTVELTSDAAQLKFCQNTNFDADGTYTLTAKIVDRAGNETAASTATLRMDRSAPTAASINRGTASWNMSGPTAVYRYFTNDTATQMTVSADSNVSGLKSYAYLAAAADPAMDNAALAALATPAADDARWVDLGTKTNFALTEGFSGRLFLKTTDNAGNVTIIGSDGVAVEKTAPTVSYSNTTPLPAGFTWYDTNPTFAITAADGGAVATGIGTISVYETPDGGKPGSETVIYTADGYQTNAQVNYQTHTQGQFTLTIVVRDRAGNVTTTTTEKLMVDASNPALQITMTSQSKTYVPGTWTNKQINVSLASPGTVSAVKYFYSLDNTNWTALAGNTYTVNENFNETVYFKAQSLSGKESTDSRSMKMQRTIASNVTGFTDEAGNTLFSLVATDTPNANSWRNKAFDVTIVAPYNIQRTNTAGELRDQAQVTTTYTTECAQTQNGSYDTIAALSGSLVGGVGAQPVTLHFSADGYYRITVRASDEAGNTVTTSYVVSYQLDTTAPTDCDLKVGDSSIRTLLSKLTFNLFYKETIGFTTAVNYNISGKQTAEYASLAITDKDTLDKIKSSDSVDESLLTNWTAVPSNGTFYSTGEFTGLYFVRFTDKAGNVTVINSNGMVIDLYPPTVSTLTPHGSLTTTDGTATEADFNASLWYRSVKVDIATQDVRSGIDRIEIYHIAENGTQTLIETRKGADLGIDDFLGLHNQPYTGTYVTSASGAYKVMIRVYDGTGEYTQSQTALLHVDGKQPALTVTKKDGTQTWTDGKWTKNDVTFALSVGTVTAPVTYQYRIDGGAWTNINANNGKYTITVSQDTNAVYCFRALLGDATTPAWVVYENGSTVYTDTGYAAPENHVKVQKTPPRAFADSDFAAYEYVENPTEETSFTGAAPNAAGWYNKLLTVRVSLPQPTNDTHAGMTTAYTLSLDGTTVQSGTSNAADTHLFFPMNGEGTYTLTLLTTDEATNTNTRITKTYKVDATAPNLETIKVGGTPITWMENTLNKMTFGQFFKHATIDIQVNYDKSGRQTLEYQLCQAKTFEELPQPVEGAWQAIAAGSSSFQITNDFRGVIYVRAQDNADNHSVVWVTDGLVSDGTAPTLTVTASAAGAAHAGAGWTADSDTAVATDWLNTNATVTVSAADTVEDLNTLKTVRYTVNGGSAVTLYDVSATGDAAETEGMADATLPVFSTDGTSVIVVTAEDRSGNVTTRTMTVNVDQSAPVAENIQINVNNTDIRAVGESAPNYYLQNCTAASIEAEVASQISGVADVSFQLTDNGEPTEGKWVSADQFEKVLAACANRSFVIVVKVTDLAGNSTTVHSRRVFMDTQAPTVVISGNPTEWTANDVTLTIAASDDISGLQAEPYSFDGGTTWTSNTAATFSANGNVDVWVRDNAGNLYKETVQIRKIDKLPPNNGSVTNGAWYTSATWYHSDQTVAATFAGTEGTAGYAGCNEWLQYQITDASDPTKNTDWVDGASFDVTVAGYDQGTTTVAYRVIDELGRTYALAPAIVNLDSTAPAAEKVEIYGAEPDQLSQNLRKILEAGTFGLFFNETLTVTINADCTVSGEQEIRYYLSSDETARELSPDDALWSTAPVYSGEFSLPVRETHRGVIYARVTDKAGNQTVVATNLVVVDATQPDAPTVSANGGYTADTWTNGSVVFSVSGANNTVAGIERYEYAVQLRGESNYGAWQTAQDGAVTVAAPANGTFVAGYKFRAVSYTGIAGAETVFGLVKQDTAAPKSATVTISNGSAEVVPDANTWYKDDTLTVRVAQDEGSAPVAAWYKTKEDGVWKLVSLADNSGEIELDHGVNHIWVQTVDDAGNRDSENGTEYQVLYDNGNPALTVNAGEYTGGYADQQVTLAIHSESVSPFYRFEILKNGTVVETLVKGDPRLTVSDAGALGGLNTADCTYEIPKGDTDGDSYTVIAYTRATNDASDTTVYGSAQSSAILYQYDATAPRFTADNITYTYLNSGNIAQLAHTLSFGLFFKESVRVTVALDTTGENGTVGSALRGFEVTATDALHTVSTPVVTGGDGAYTAQFDVPVGFSGDITMTARDTIAFGTDNATSLTLSHFVADDTAPELTLSPSRAADNGEWYRGEFSVDANASDPLAGLYSLTITVNSGDPIVVSPSEDSQQNTLSKTLDFSESGSYQIVAVAEDNAGNTTTQTLQVKLDATVPALLVAAVAGGQPYSGTWTKDPVVLTPSISNAASAISGCAFYYTAVEPGTEPETWTTGNAKPDAWVPLTENSVEITTDTAKDYYFKALTGAGIVSDAVRQAVRISNSTAQAPTLQTDYTGGWTNQTVVVNLSTGAANTPFGGVAAYQYNTGSGWQTIETSTGDSGNLTGAVYTVAANWNGSVQFRTLSNSGVASAVTDSLAIQVDTTNPASASITIDDGSGNEVAPVDGTWYADGTLTATTTQESGWAQNRVQYKTTGEWMDVAENTITLALGINSIYIRTADAAGNYNNESGTLYTVWHDNGQPQLTVDTTVGESGEEYTGGYTNEQVALALCSTSIAPFRSFEIYCNDQLVKTLPAADVSITPPAAIGTDPYTAKASYQLPRSDVDGAVYKVVATTTATAGGSTVFGSATSGEIAYNYDATAPQYTVSEITYTTVNGDPLARAFNTLSFGLFFKEAVKVNVSVNNAGTAANGSALRNFWYTLAGGAQSAATITGGENNRYVASFVVAPEYRGDILLRAADTIAFGSDNETTGTIVNLAADTQQPEITIAPAGEANAAGWYNTAVPFTVTAQDATAGMHNMVVTVNGVIVTDQTADTQMPSMTYTQPLSETGVYPISVTAVDNAGNEYSANQEIKVDVATPSFSLTAVSGDNAYDGTWTKQDITMTVADLGDQRSGLTWYFKTAEGDWTLMSGTAITVDSDTDTVYSFKAVSGAGLESEIQTQTVKLSKTVAAAPTVTTDYTDHTWTNADVRFALSVAGASLPFGGLSHYEVSIDGESWMQLGGDSYTISNNQTVKTVRFRSVSLSGVPSAASAPCTVKIDKVTPNAAVLKIDGAVVNSDTWYQTAAVAVSVAQKAYAPTKVQYSADNATWSDVADGTITLQGGENVFYIRTLDEATNASAPVQYTLHAELADPAAPAFTVNPVVASGSWTNTPVTFTVSGAAAAPIQAYQYSVDGGTSWVDCAGENHDTLTVPAAETASTSYTFRILTVSGRTSPASSAYVVQLDQTAPIVGSNIQYQYYNDNAFTALLSNLTGGMFFGTKIKVTVTAADSGSVQSGVKTLTYALADQDPVTVAADAKGQVNFEIDNPYTGGLSVFATDLAGNRSDSVAVTSDFTVDTTVIGAPTVSTNGYDGSSYTAPGILYTLTNSTTMNAAGVKEYQYSLDGGTTWNNAGTTAGGITYAIQNIESPITGATVTVTAADETTFTGTILFRALSLAKVSESEFLAGEATNAFNVKLDTVKPVIASVTGGSDAWQQGTTLSVSLSTTPLSGVSYWYSTDQTDYVKMDGASVKVDRYFNGTYSFKAISGTGVASEVVSVPVQVSPDAPTAPVITAEAGGSAYTGAWTNHPITYSAGGSTVSGFDPSSSGVLRYEISSDGSTWESYTENSLRTIDTNQNGTVYFRAVSVSGVNSATVSLALKYWDTISQVPITVAGTAVNENWY